MQSLNTQALGQTCSVCNQPFTCGSQAGQEHCWCMDLPHLNPKEINPHQSCLCPNCLKAAISKFTPKG